MRPVSRSELKTFQIQHSTLLKTDQSFHPTPPPPHQTGTGADAGQRGGRGHPGPQDALGLRRLPDPQPGRWVGLDWTRLIVWASQHRRTKKQPPIPVQSINHSFACRHRHQARGRGVQARGAVRAARAGPAGQGQARRQGGARRRGRACVLGGPPKNAYVATVELILTD